MAIRLVAFDLDDTALLDDQSLSPRTIEVVRRAQEKGVYVTAATGRMYVSMAPFAKELGLASPVIVCQGAQLMDPATGEELTRWDIPLDLMHEVLDMMEEEGVYTQIYEPERFCFAEEGEYNALYTRLSSVPGQAVGRLSAYVKEPTTKMLCIDTPEKIRALWEKARERFGERLEIAVSKPFYLEITHPQANKGSALLALGERLGVARGEIMAIGDSHNDVPMLRAAGVSVAVGNAPDDIKAICTYTVGRNSEDGVAEAIEKYVLADE